MSSAIQIHIYPKIKMLPSKNLRLLVNKNFKRICFPSKRKKLLIKLKIVTISKMKLKSSPVFYTNKINKRFEIPVSFIKRTLKFQIKIIRSMSLRAAKNSRCRLKWLEQLVTILTDVLQSQLINTALKSNVKIFLSVMNKEKQHLMILHCYPAIHLLSFLIHLQLTIENSYQRPQIWEAKLPHLPLNGKIGLRANRKKEMLRH